MDLTGNYTSSFSAPDDGEDDGTDTFQAQYRCADLYNVDSENYDTLVSKTFQSLKVEMILVLVMVVVSLKFQVIMIDLVFLEGQTMMVHGMKEFI